MNKYLQKFARKTLKADLRNLSETTQLMFKRMYSGGDLKKDIDKVVDTMPSEKLDWAMQQVKRTMPAAKLLKGSDDR